MNDKENMGAGLEERVEDFRSALKKALRVGVASCLTLGAAGIYLIQEAGERKDLEQRISQLEKENAQLTEQKRRLNSHVNLLTSITPVETEPGNVKLEYFEPVMESFPETRIYYENVVPAFNQNFPDNIDMQNMDPIKLINFGAAIWMTETRHNCHYEETPDGGLRLTENYWLIFRDNLSSVSAGGCAQMMEEFIDLYGGEGAQVYEDSAYEKGWELVNHRKELESELEEVKEESYEHLTSHRNQLKRGNDIASQRAGEMGDEGEMLEDSIRDVRRRYMKLFQRYNLEAAKAVAGKSEEELVGIDVRFAPQEIGRIFVNYLADMCQQGMCADHLIALNYFAEHPNLEPQQKMNYIQTSFMFRDRIGQAMRDYSRQSTPTLRIASQDSSLKTTQVSDSRDEM